MEPNENTRRNRSKRKKRNVKDTIREDPSSVEWAQAMAKTGGEGGCEATVIKYLQENEEYDRKEIIQVPNEGTTQEEKVICYPDELMEAIKKMKYKRAVPQNRARK